MFRAGQRMSDGSWSGLRTMTTGTAGSSSQPSQVANWARSGIATAPGMCPAAMSATGRTSTGAAPVDLGEPAEVRRVRAEAGLELGDEGVRVRCLQQRVGGPLPADGGGAGSAGWGGAERSGAVGGPHRSGVGQGGEAVQRLVLGARQLLGPVGAEQGGARGGADDQ